jgi:hypothetical protein
LALLSGFDLTAIATLRAAAYPYWSGILLLVTGLEFPARFLHHRGIAAHRRAAEWHF